MINFIKKYWFFISLAFLAGLVSGYKLLTHEGNALPVVRAIAPLPGEEIEPQSRNITIDFNSVPKDTDKFTINVSPTIDLTTSFTGNRMIIEFKEPLEKSAKYFFEISFAGTTLYSWSYQIKVSSVSPSPSPLPSSATPSATVSADGKGDPDAREKISQELDKNYPLTSYLPYENTDFYLNYLSPLTLIVKIKKGTQEEVSEKVLAWIEEKGIDPATHTIEWTR